MSETNLVLRFEAPLQAWGDSSKGKDKGTSEAPTKSGVVGLLGAALGIERGGDFSLLNRLAMAVRVDKPGRLLMDFQSMSYRKDDLAGAHSVQNPEGKEYAKNLQKNRIFYKQYLVEASFLVVLTGDSDLISLCADALHNPVYPLYLGRKNCVPSLPVLVGIKGGTPEEVLTTVQLPEGPDKVRILRDVRDGERGSLARDVLVDSSTEHRVFAYREVVDEQVSLTTHDPFAILDFKETTL